MSLIDRIKRSESFSSLYKRNSDDPLYKSKSVHRSPASSFTATPTGPMDFGQQFWLFVRKVKSEVRNEPEKFEKALAHLPIATVQQMKSIYIPPYQIDRTGPLLGSGQFGQVMKGTFGTATVCIKSTKIESAAHNPGLAEQLSKDIFKEAVHMKEMEHENVMHLLGSHFRFNFRFSSN